MITLHHLSMAFSCISLHWTVPLHMARLVALEAQAILASVCFLVSSLLMLYILQCTDEAAKLYGSWAVEIASTIHTTLHTTSQSLDRIRHHCTSLVV